MGERRGVDNTRRNEAASKLYKLSCPLYFFWKRMVTLQRHAGCITKQKRSKGRKVSQE